MAGFHWIFGSVSIVTIEYTRVSETARTSTKYSSVRFAQRFITVSFFCAASLESIMKKIHFQQVFMAGLRIYISLIVTVE